MTDWPIKIFVQEAEGQIALEIEDEVLLVRKGDTINLSKPVLQVEYNVTEAKIENDGDELPKPYQKEWISLDIFRVMMDSPDVLNWLRAERIPFVEPGGKSGGMIRKVVAMRYVPEPFKGALKKEISEVSEAS